jgi:hypothetical protein
MKFKEIEKLILNDGWVLKTTSRNIGDDDYETDLPCDIL